MSVRAKFKCIQKVPPSEVSGNGACVRFEPVTSGSEENEKFFKATPYGGAELGGLLPGTADSFIVGKDYYLDFTLAE